MAYDIAARIARADVQLPGEGKSLQEKLDQFSEFLNEAAPKYKPAYEQFVANLNDALSGNGAPAVGDPFHQFALPNQDGQVEELQSLLRRGPLIVSFSRGAWCNYCQLELQDLKQFHETEVAGRGSMVSISPDTSQAGRLLRAHHDLPFSILSDQFCGFALLCGLALMFPPALKELYLEREYDVSEFQGNQSWMVPIPATFVLSSDGIVRHRFLDRDFRTRQTREDLTAAFDDVVRRDGCDPQSV